MSLDVYLTVAQPVDVFSKNITHNLGDMAAHAGLYLPLWRPEELDCNTAADLIPYLEIGLKQLEHAPDYFKGYNPKNGWGTYEHLVIFTRDYLAACKSRPYAEIRVSR